ncbi:hypothetical protein C1Y40_02829 [Mycobacterium talmoniae]|uniref:Secreted protein n=1 Tax=Mycobacterium talmoniae TaxID=1858794 RepID=A0A2S8BK61_9MYCO|nr:hypothetical protein C1Y40_02829 [Mycobacterium talmoniae]
MISKTMSTMIAVAISMMCISRSLASARSLMVAAGPAKSAARPDPAGACLTACLTMSVTRSYAS